MAVPTRGQGLIAEIDRDASAGESELRLRGLIGIAEGTTVNIYAAGNPLPGNPFVVDGYDATARTVQLDHSLGEDLQAERDYLEIQAPATPSPGPPDTRTLRFRAKSVGSWGDGLSVRVRPMVGATLNILPDPAVAGSPASTTLTVDAAEGDTSLSVDDGAGFSAGDRVMINGAEFDVTSAGANSIDIAPAAPGAWPTGTSVRRLRPANTAGAGDTIAVEGAGQLYVDALVEVDNGSAKEYRTVQSVDGDQVTLGGGNLDEAYYEGHKLRVVEAEVLARYQRNGVIEAEERFTNLRLVDDGSFSYIVTYINTESALVDVEEFPGLSTNDPTAFPIATTDLWDPLIGGNDDAAALTPDDFVGVDGGSGNRTGIQALEDIDEISIVLAPGIWSQTVRSALIQHCEILKDRFAVLDPQDELNIEEVRSVRETIDSKYAAIYYPWIEVRDPSVGRDVTVAPSGHIAGIYARVDVERGVFKAPANEVIRGIRKIAQDVTKREQDMLNPEGINALRFFPGRGNRVWGARTVTSDSSWKYVSVRRLFIFIEESIDEGTQWVVFEPNDEPLWARVRQTITNFLTTQWRSGALQGSTPDEAFFVKCDRTTMTQDDIDNGRLICVIGIAPVKPAEFVIFRIQQKTLEAQQV